LKDPIISAEAAMYKVQQSHTYKNRLDQIIDHMATLKSV
ncbi:glycosyltransferase, partial [Acinetobacter baumannii]